MSDELKYYSQREYEARADATEQVELDAEEFVLAVHGECGAYFLRFLGIHPPGSLSHKALMEDFLLRQNMFNAMIDHYPDSFPSPVFDEWLHDRYMADHLGGARL